MVDLTLRNMLIGVVIVGMVLFGAFAFVSEQTINSGVPGVALELETQFSNTTANVAKMQETSEALRETVETANLVSVTGFAALFSGSFAVLRLILNALTLPFAIFIDISNALGLPWWFLAGVVSILTIIVVLAISNIIFGRGRA